MLSDCYKKIGYQERYDEYVVEVAYCPNTAAGKDGRLVCGRGLPPDHGNGPCSACLARGQTVPTHRTHGVVGGVPTKQPIDATGSSDPVSSTLICLWTTNSLHPLRKAGQQLWRSCRWIPRMMRRRSMTCSQDDGHGSSTRGGGAIFADGPPRPASIPGCPLTRPLTRPLLTADAPTGAPWGHAISIYITYHTGPRHICGEFGI